jgi:hypothetical protein
MVVACHIVLGVGRRGCHFMLSMVQYIIQLSFMRSNTNSKKLSQRDQKIMADFPVDVRSATAQFSLEGKHMVYATCPNPKCHRTYKPVFEGDSPIPKYPTFCSHREFHDGSSCKQRLLRPRGINNRETQVPIKPFVYFDFKDWVGGLMAHPRFEDKMDAAWRATNVNAPEMHDIFDGEALKNFQGPDGRHFSLGDGEARYVFSLCVDFFNPSGNKQSGKKISCGIISLVCLNLPPDLRYKPENMFLAGVIPGPNEPPLTALNHYLTPLVNDLLEFWKPGVWLSRTHNYPNGRLCRCALVALVCDLPAARKAAGFAAHSHHHFCSICHCTRAQGYGGTDLRWRRRTNAECRVYADRYNKARNEKERQSIFDASGLRWSELLRLPYFDIAQFVVVDAMHNLFLGLIKEHFDGILGIRCDKEAEQPVFVVNLSDDWKAFTPTEQASVKRLKRWLEAPMSEELSADQPSVVKKFMRCHGHALEFVCSSLHCPPVPSKKPPSKKPSKIECVNTLLQWVSAFIIY